MQIKNPIVWKMECFQMVGFSDSMSIIRYDSIRDYHVMNVRDLVFVMAAAGGDLSQIKSWHLSYFGASLCLLVLRNPLANIFRFVLCLFLRASRIY